MKKRINILNNLNIKEILKIYFSSFLQKKWNFFSGLKESPGGVLFCLDFVWIPERTFVLVLCYDIDLSPFFVVKFNFGAIISPCFVSLENFTITISSGYLHQLVKSKLSL